MHRVKCLGLHALYRSDKFSDASRADSALPISARLSGSDFRSTRFICCIFALTSSGMYGPVLRTLRPCARGPPHPRFTTKPGECLRLNLPKPTHFVILSKSCLKHSGVLARYVCQSQVLEKHMRLRRRLSTSCRGNCCRM